MKWSYPLLESVGQPMSERLKVFPPEKDITFTIMRYIWNGLMRLWLKVYFRLEIAGKEHLPRNDSFLLIANHSSHLDAVCLLAALPWRSINSAFSAAAKDYFFSSFIRSFFSAIFFNAIPFERKKIPRKSLELCADVLNASKHALIMFPEGTRSFDGTIQPFKNGIGFLVAGTQRIVVPAYIDGAHSAWPKGGFPKPRKVLMKIGAPLSFSQVPRTKEGFFEVSSMAQKAVEQLQNGR